MKTIKTAIRNITKFKSYTAINFVGLVLGLSVFITLISYVAFEFSFDKFHAGHEQTYRINEFATNPKSTERGPTIRVPFAPALADQVSEIEDYNRVIPRSRLLVKSTDKTIKLEKLLFADNNFFDFFTFDLKQGPSGLKLTKGEIVLTSLLAERLFGEDDPHGKIVEIQEQEYTVVAVAEVPPKNSHIQFDAVTSISALIDRPNVYQGWDGGVSAHSFIKLNKYANIEAVEGKIADFVYDKVNKKNEGSGFFTQFYLEQLSRIHLFSNVEWDNFSKAEFKDVLMLLAISILVLLIAVFNFISISKGILAFRAKEFRMKYVLGAGNMEPFRQLFTENLLLLGTAALVSYVLILSFNTSISSLFGYSFDFISIRFGLKIITSVVLLTTLAFVSTIAVLQGLKQKSLSDKGNYQGNSKQRNRKLEYVTAFQFVISIALIASVFFIQKQLHYALNKDLGFQKENIVQFSHYSIGKKQDVLVKEFKDIPGVKNVSATFGIPGLETTRNGYKPEGGEQYYLYSALHVDENFLETFDIELLDGSNLTKEQSGTKPFLVNETLAKTLGWENPIGKTLFRNNKHHQVIGVVKDFHLASIYMKIEPLILSMQMQKDYYSLSVLVDGENLPETMAQMKDAWAKVMPGLPFDYSFFSDKFANMYKRVERKKNILSIFTIIAVLISMLGIFGVTLLIINGKTKEIGIRKVNGAKVSEILSMLNKDFIKWVAVAFVVATPIAYYAMNKWLESFAYKTTLSWWIFVLAGLLALGIALLTVSWQSWRAATRNPVEALRYE